MKTTKYIFASLLLAVGLVACQGETENTTTEEPKAEEICVYSYNEGTSTLEWTAYKTTAKVGVAGTFNDIEVSSEEANDPKTVLESISFTINTGSVETNNEDRNGKVAEHFFGTINTPTIEGEVESLNEDGSAVINITMNGVTFAVEGEYTLEGREFAFNSSIDVSNWNGMPGIEALNKVCEDLHTGEDGVSKLWSEVGLSFSTRLKSDCK